MAANGARRGPDAWRHEIGEQDGKMPCPLGRCDTHTSARYSHYLVRHHPVYDGLTMVAIMLNPSCPDERNSMFGRVRNLCDEPGSSIDRIAFLNVFAYRGRHLTAVSDADVRSVAARNHAVVRDVLSGAAEVIVAWGAGPPRELGAAWDDEMRWFSSALTQTSCPVLDMSGRRLHPRAWRRHPNGGYRPNLLPFNSATSGQGGSSVGSP